MSQTEHPLGIVIPSGDYGPLPDGDLQSIITLYFKKLQLQHPPLLLPRSEEIKSENRRVHFLIKKTCLYSVMICEDSCDPLSHIVQARIKLPRLSKCTSQLTLTLYCASVFYRKLRNVLFSRFTKGSTKCSHSTKFVSYIK